MSSDAQSAAATRSKPSLTITRKLSAPPDRCFRAWTDPQALKHWFGPGASEVVLAEADPRVGGRYRVVMRSPGGEEHDVSGEFREVVANRKLVFTWAWRSTPERQSLVTVEFTPAGAETALTLTHEQFADGAARDRHHRGWTASLDKLATLELESFNRREINMPDHQVVSRDDWLAARIKLLAEEKEFTRRRDELTRHCRELPWVRIEDYAFDGPGGKVRLSDLFRGKSQLIVYHFMFHPDWNAGCKSCSYWADNYERVVVHLRARDTNLVAVSRAPFAKIEAFRNRMGWTFEWVSCGAEGVFNRNFGAYLTKEDLAKEGNNTNYGTRRFTIEDVPAISVFSKNRDGGLYHTYSTYSRGLDMFNGAYHYLDIVPKGRDEEKLKYHMDWVRLRDEYA